ncbi:MAG: phage holin family protein [Solobacterium sp.]|nr:phage holin family protein [Solobacterium sp.]
MTRLLRSLILSALSLWVIDVLLEGVFFRDAKTLIVTAIVLGVLNAVVKPILKVLTLPINVMTFGIFSFLLNGIVLYTAFQFSGGNINSVLTATIAAILLTIVNGTFEKLFGKK